MDRRSIGFAELEVRVFSDKFPEVKDFVEKCKEEVATFEGFLECSHQHRKPECSHR